MTQQELVRDERHGQSPGQDSEEEIFPAEQQESSARSGWTVFLGLLVIAAAIGLGLVLGWRGAAWGLKSASSPANALASDTASSPAAQGTSAGNTETAADSSPTQTKPSSPSNAEVPSGGLVVTQNGKVIYRMEPERHIAANSGLATSSAPASSSPSRLIHRVEPQYPLEARERHIQGSVVLDVQVQGEGAVGNIDVVQGDPLLSEAAVDAVRQWRYQPYFVDGRPVESQTRITIKFTLPAN